LEEGEMGGLEGRWVGTGEGIYISPGQLKWQKDGNVKSFKDITGLCISKALFILLGAQN
jgi:hypothetical protein